MAYIFCNPNPCNKIVGDCVIRAISIAFGIPWINAYTDLCVFGMENCDIPSSNNLWGAYLRKNGYSQKSLSNDCPYCYTVEQFANEHPVGTFIVATGSHAVCVKDGNWIDSFDSASELVAYYFEKR